ncbi:NAD(P)-dependent oxidoreductase [Rhizobium sp. Root1203]|uniref:SDR family oxidoreductase n=1 Tax=Rhizobium sp. Root1203 TaxID=1736427 RepID=UPI0007103B52|nr:SDR family oxidoreductase [Rhizobium sp. Root1203]KQV17327.1 NAD(P)-dependent oxidoreductase [Rhizobium sp. Root1203]
MPSRLEGKRALVTAAAQGIGTAVAQRLTAEGAEVIAGDINGEGLSVLKHTVFSTEVFDGSDPIALAAVVAAQDRPIDILVNCVGWVHQGTILDCDLDAWKRSFTLNIDSVYHAIQAVLPGMIAQGRGSIINIASIASSVKAVANRAAYSATKAAVIGLTKSVSIDYVGKGIRCNAICPGTIESPSLQDRINSFADPVKARGDFISRQPMGRLGKPDEIAGLSAYLASDESAFMTGSVVIIDGGMAA